MCSGAFPNRTEGLLELDEGGAESTLRVSIGANVVEKTNLLSNITGG
jgi:hypothetical protein